ncbi:MAG: hypothetical protein ABIG84_07360 [archaeon]
MKGISMAILGFITIGLAMGGLIWVQYNANLGINQKITSTESLVFLRLNEETEKIQSYVESSFGMAVSHAVDIAARSGGSNSNDTRYWQCVIPQVPDVDEMQAIVNDETMDGLNSYIAMIEERNGPLLIDVEPASCINTDYSPDKDMIAARGDGIEIKISDRSAYASTDEWIVEKNTGPNNFWRDYEVLKRWVENDEIKKMIAKRLNDGDVIPQGLNHESCSCDKPVCPRADEVLGMTYPCWEGGIKKAVAEGVDEARKMLENNDEYFGGKNVYCQTVIRCISTKKPVVVGQKTRNYGSDLCCSESCASCKRDECAINSTRKICDGTSSESVCEMPDCEEDKADKEYCTVSLEKKEQYFGDIGMDYGEAVGNDVCKTCCAVSFGLLYETDVELTLTCQDLSSIMTTKDGIEPLKWEINMFVRATSTDGANYRASEKMNCG